MTSSYPYTIELQEDGNYFVQFIDIPEAFTEGETLEAAQYNAVEVLTGILAYRLDRNIAIPEPTPIDSGYQAYPSPEVQSAIMIRKARGTKTISELATAMQTSWPAVQRLEDPYHWPSLKQLDKAARILGKRLIISFD